MSSDSSKLDSNMILFIVTVFALCMASVESSYCTAPTGAPLHSDEFPDLLDSYQTDIEINVVDKGITIDIEEYLDFPGNRGLITFFKNGVGYRAIYNYNTDEIYDISDVDGTCRVLNLTKSGQSALFGNHEKDGIPHIYTARDALRFGKKFGQVYVGTSEIRGILTSHWTGCMWYKQKNENFTADYYFTAKNWTTASTSPQIPVRIEIKGVQTFSNGTAPRSFHRIYDFFRFRADSTVGTSFFETPKGVVCPGRINTKKMPKLPSQYYYRQETIIPSVGVITMSDVWFDYDLKLLRIDTRQDGYKPPLYTPNPVTEIHDYTLGVRYLKDRLAGNCSIWPLVNGSFGSAENLQAYKVNHSYVLHMKNPMQLFSLAGNFTYSGVRVARGGVLCDVYTSVQRNYMISGVPMNATMEFYFLSDGWSEYPNRGLSGYEDSYPYQIEVTVLEAAFHVVINILDFDVDHPRLTSFDISDCYPETSKIHFKTRFPGPYHPGIENFLIDRVHIAMSNLMNISPLRLQRFRVEADHSNIFINAVLLNTVPSWAEFTYLPGKILEHNDDRVVHDITDPRQCATLCNTNSDFSCNSFDFCVADKTCRLSRRHTDDGKIAVDSVKCDHFSRTVNNGIKTIPLAKAFSTYRSQVYKGQMYFSVMDASGNTQVYTANDVEITFGSLKSKKIPSFGDQFSYRSEMIIPGVKYVMNSAFWYDSKNELIRYDMRNPTPNTPYFSKYTASYIQDFKTGIFYRIDQVEGNCTVSAINPATDSVAVQTKTGNLHIKSPRDLFRTDVSFAYAGQQTVRGILCDVFEAVIPDYKVVETNITSRATLQYFFQAGDWITISDDGTDITKSQLIMIKHYTEYNKQFVTVNIFDFDNQYVDLNVFDVRKCFTDNQKHNFEIKFNAPYHPYLDDRKDLFLLTARQILSDLAKVSPIRLQNLAVTYNLNSVYLLVTLLDVKDVMLYFHKLNGQYPASGTALKLSGIQNPRDCARVCIEQTDFVCNSFQFCSSASECFFSSKHVPDGHLVPGQTSEMCSHYSRSANGTGPETSMMHAYEIIKDLVYKGVFIIPISYDGNKMYKYKAAEIRDTIIRPDSAQPTGGDFIKQYKVFKRSVILNHNDFVLDQVAVDDCAVACSEESRFDCQSFDYCFTTGTCYLSKIHPDQRHDLIVSHSFCDLYAKKYIMNYKLFPGQVLVGKADYIISGIDSPDMCAKQCSETTEIACHSFDICFQMKMCRLHTKHILDVPSTSIQSNPMCSHYSRDYLYDFSLKRGVIIKGNDDIVVAGVSSSECARLCVEQTNMECASFEFCPNTTTCVLSRAHTKSLVKVTLENSKACNLYLRTTLTDGTPFDPNAVVHYSFKQDNNDTGVKAALAIGMMIVGIVISAAAVLAFRRWKSRNHDNEMNVHFVKEPDSM